VLPPLVVHVRVSTRLAGSATGCVTGAVFVAPAGSLPLGVAPGQLLSRPFGNLVHTGGTGEALLALLGAAAGAAAEEVVVVGVVARLELEAAPAGRAIIAAARPEPTMPATAAARSNRRRRARELGVRLMGVLSGSGLGYDNVVKWSAAF
jgi:hypothetical protein